MVLNGDEPASRTVAARERPPLELSRVRRIGVVRALPGLGDLLCAVPALRALRAAVPRARITFVGLASARWFVDRFDHLVDELLVVEGWPGLPEAPARRGAAARLVRAGRRRHFDIVLQLHGDGRVTNELAASLGATYLVAPDHPGGPVADIRGPFDPREPEVLRLLDLAERAGARAAGSALELPITDEERHAASALIGQHDRRYAVVHPGSSTPRRRWDAAGFAWIGERLHRAGHRVALTGSSGERRLVAEVAASMSSPAVALAGSTPDVGTLAAVIDGAAVVVCNDTGVSHVAAALRTPSVILFHSAEITRWAPLARTLHVPVVLAGLDLAAQRVHVGAAVADLLRVREDAA